MNQFRILTRGRYCSKWLGTCIKSVIAQTYPNWTCLILLDSPDKESFKIAKKYAEIDKRIGFCLQGKQRGVAYNTYHGFRHMENNPEDIDGIVDSDDSIPKDALARVNRKYEKDEKLLITHGSYWRYDLRKKTKTSKPYKNIRQLRKVWHGSHLKTFKHKLFMKIPKHCFKDNEGNWFQAASDLALMIPMIEMAGLDRTLWINSITYRWRRTEFKSRGHLQKRAKRCIFKKKPFKRLKKI